MGELEFILYVVVKIFAFVHSLLEELRVGIGFCQLVEIAVHLLFFIRPFKIRVEDVVPVIPPVLGIKVHCTGGCHKQCACFPFTIGKVSGSLFVEGKGVLHVVDSHGYPEDEVIVRAIGELEHPTIPTVKAAEAVAEGEPAEEQPAEEEPAEEAPHD